MTTRRFVVLVLAAYRLAYLVANERGPFYLAQRLRTAVYGRYGSRSWQWEGITCPLCISFWLAFALRFAPRWVLDSVGAAGGVLIIHRALEAFDGAVES